MPKNLKSKKVSVKDIREQIATLDENLKILQEQLPSEISARISVLGGTLGELAKNGLNDNEIAIDTENNNLVFGKHQSTIPLKQNEHFFLDFFRNGPTVINQFEDTSHFYNSAQLLYRSTVVPPIVLIKTSQGRVRGIRWDGFLTNQQIISGSTPYLFNWSSGISTGHSGELAQGLLKTCVIYPTNTFGLPSLSNDITYLAANNVLYADTSKLNNLETLIITGGFCDPSNNKKLKTLEINFGRYQDIYCESSLENVSLKGDFKNIYLPNLTIARPFNWTSLPSGHSDSNGLVDGRAESLYLDNLVYISGFCRLTARLKHISLKNLEKIGGVDIYNTSYGNLKGLSVDLFEAPKLKEINSFNLFYEASIREVKIDAVDMLTSYIFNNWDDYYDWPGSYNSLKKISATGVTTGRLDNDPNSSSGYGVNAIGAQAFAGQTSLQTIKIPNLIGKISMWAFRGCSSLSGIWLNTPYENINESAFEGSALSIVHIRPEPFMPSGWTTGSNISVGGRNVTVIADWHDWPNQPD